MKRIALFALLATSVAFGTQHGIAETKTHNHGAHSPYSGMTDRHIKALSNDDLAGLRNGKGISLALPAELNGYPGPVHVLELADQIALSPDQRAETEKLFADMKAKAIALGHQVIMAEAALEKVFTEGPADADALHARSLEAAEAWGRLRAHHLGYHLKMVALLSAEQTAAYRKARGYR